jgi:hypothetical protein
MRQHGATGVGSQQTIKILQLAISLWNLNADAIECVAEFQSWQIQVSELADSGFGVGRFNMRICSRRRAANNWQFSAD